MSRFRPLTGPVLAGLVLAAVTAPVLAPARALAEDASETVVGELTRTWADDGEDGSGAEPLSWVRTDSGRTVPVSPEDVAAVEVGSTVELSLAAEGSGGSSGSAEKGPPPARVVDTAVLAAPVAAAATPTNEVTIVRIVPAGGATDFTRVADVVAQVTGPVHDYWAEQSGGDIELSATGWPDWVRVAAGCDDPYAILDQAAAHVGFVPGPGRHLLAYLRPDTLTACGHGFAEQGTSPGDGGMAYLKGMVTADIAHELGHNFGLGDSATLKCSTSPSIPSLDAGSCYVNPANDPYDVMGWMWEQLGSLNMAQADLLGFLGSTDQAVVLGGGPPVSRTLLPVSGQAGLRAMKIVLPGESAGPYWLEYRTATGRDAWLGDDRNRWALETGVFLRRAGSDGEDTSLLLDGSPSTESALDDRRLALPVGTTVEVAGGRANGGFSVNVDSVSSGGAAVRVSTAPPPSVGPPTGNWEVLSTGPFRSGLTVSGWAIDRDDPAFALQVVVTVDGRESMVTANGSRPDVGAYFPGAGHAHGFSWVGSVTPGTHQVCVQVMDAFVPSASTSLGCRSITSQMAMPVGNWEVLTASGNTLAIAGWAFDPDAPSWGSEVRIFVDGHETQHHADRPRPDVAAAFPGAGGALGFSASLSVAPGDHQVCVYALDGDLSSRRTSLGCRSIGTQVAAPVGNWEVLSADGPTVTVSGWAYDPDATATASEVHVYVDGSGAVVMANRSRPDVGAVLGVGDSHGFSWSRTVPPGTHRVCAYAIDVEQPAWRNTSLGCRSIATQVTPPIGNFEVLSASGSTLTVKGWAVDPDATGTASEVHVYVDGRASVVTANRSRPDVSAALGVGDSHGFDWSGTVRPGTHTVCAYAIDVEQPAWRNTALGCRTITTQQALPVANWDVLASSGPTVTVKGWAIDPDERTAAVPVHVYVDGGGTPLMADRSRPDVGSAFPGAGDDHGFEWSVGLAPGRHTVCVYAIDREVPSRNLPLGCRAVTT